MIFPQKNGHSACSASYYLACGEYYYIPLQYHQTRTLTLSNGVVLAASGSIPFSTNPLVIVEKVDEDTLMVYSTEFVDVQSGQNEIRVKPKNKSLKKENKNEK